jgi:hypothetical protein
MSMKGGHGLHVSPRVRMELVFVLGGEETAINKIS